MLSGPFTQSLEVEIILVLANDKSIRVNEYEDIRSLRLV